MGHRTGMFVALLLQLSISAIGVAQGPPCPDERPVTGVYRNFNYGFTITVPRGLGGYWNGVPCVRREDGSCACVSDHGISIPLGSLPEDGSIGVYAAHNSEEWTLPTRVFHDILAFTKRRPGEDVSVISLQTLSFRGHRAYRYSITAVNRDGTSVRREAVLFHTLGGQDSVVLDLEAPDRLFQQHEAHFRAILASWHASPRA